MPGSTTDRAAQANGAYEASAVRSSSMGPSQNGVGAIPASAEVTVLRCSSEGREDCEARSGIESCCGGEIVHSGDVPVVPCAVVLDGPPQASKRRRVPQQNRRDIAAVLRPFLGPPPMVANRRPMASRSPPDFPTSGLGVQAQQGQLTGLPGRRGAASSGAAECGRRRRARLHRTRREGSVPG